MPETLVLVVFWRRAEDGTIEFFVPRHQSYIDAMTHMASGQPAVAAGLWVEKTFGFRPRNNGRIFAVSVGSAVAFTLYGAEATTLMDRPEDEKGSWSPVSLIDEPAKAILGDLAARL